MYVTIDLPEDAAMALQRNQNGNLSRRVLEAVAIEGYRSGELTRAQVRRLLGFEHRLDVDAFFKEHGVPMTYTLEDLEEDQEAHRALGLR